jgi:hypothetical protein
LSPRLRSTSAILVAFAVPLGVYLASLRGDVSYWDTADLQTVPYILGIPYPTGFPGYVLIGWVWSHAFVLGDVAWRLNVLNALACAGTAAALAALLISLGAATPIGFGAALAYGLASMPWKHATYVDVHPLAFCAVAWAVVYGFRWVRSAAWFDAIACVVATVIALGCDNSTALALPGLAFIALGRRPPLRRAAVLIAGGAVAVVAIYAYLPLRSNAVKTAHLDPTAALGVPAGRPYWNDGDPSTPAGFIRVVTGSDFAPHEAVAGMMSRTAIGHVVDDFAPLAYRDLGGLLPWIALFGAAMLWWRFPLVLGGLLLVGLLPLLFASAYVVESEATRYYLPAYFAVVAFAGYGVAVFDAGMHGMQRYALLAVIGCAWAVLLGTDWYASAPLFDQPNEPGSGIYIKRIAQITPKRAIVIAPWNYATPLAYGAYVLHSLDERIVLTAGAHEYQSSYRSWMAGRPVVVVSEDKQTFKGFHVTELDDGDPHVYALR